MDTIDRPTTDSPNSVPKPLWLIPLVLLVAAVAPWPYGYFMLLRLMVCGASIWLAYSLIQRSELRSLGWIFVVLALLYNPVFRVHFEREVWIVLNIISAAPFALVGWRTRVRQG